MGYPDIAVFDLDYTIWPCYCDTHINPPFSPVKSSNGEIRTLVDSHGFEISPFKDVFKILLDLKKNNVKLLSASRTWAPDIAIAMLKKFTVVDPETNEKHTMFELFDDCQWGEMSKVNHIRNGLKEIYPSKSQTLQDYSIVLYDDESRNKDVEKYGVKFMYLRDPEKGVTWEIYQKSLK